MAGSPKNIRRLKLCCTTAPSVLTHCPVRGSAGLQPRMILLRSSGLWDHSWTLPVVLLCSSTAGLPAPACSALPATTSAALRACSCCTCGVAAAEPAAVFSCTVVASPWVVACGFEAPHPICEQCCAHGVTLKYAACTLARRSKANLLRSATFLTALGLYHSWYSYRVGALTCWSRSLRTQLQSAPALDEEALESRTVL